MSFFSCPDCGEKISLKDKKCNNCNTEFSDELKKKILTMKVIIAVGGGFLIFGIILYFLFKTDSSDISNKELLNYNTNYYMQEDNNYYIMFLKKTDTTGTCYMQVSTESCNYEIVDNNKIIINSEMTNRGVKLKMYSAYNIIDKDTIKRVEINISSKDINPSPTADDTIFTTDYDSTEKKEFTLNAPYYKKYSLAGDSKNPKATIEFLSASVCDIDFSKSAKSVDIGRREYMHISYTKGLCTYEKLNDYDLKIKYTGTFSIIHPVSQLSVYNIPVFNNVNNEMRITFEEGYNSFNITNGKWAYSNFALYFKDDTTKYTLYINSDGKVVANPNSACLFESFRNLTEIENLEYLDTRNVTDMRTMFYGCSNLTTLDLSNFDTSNVTDMSGMFYNCSNLTALNLSIFDTSNVTDMRNMFYGCSNLTTLDLSSFDTSKVTDMSYMFCDCSSLNTLDLSNFDTRNVTDMDGMFILRSKLTTLDLSNVDASIITNEKIFSVMPAAITIIVKDKAAQDALLAHPDKKSTWTIDNIIIKG